MDTKIPLPRRKPVTYEPVMYGYSTYKRLPLVVKAFQWPGWSAHYDPLSIIRKLPALTALRMGLALGQAQGTMGLPPSSLGYINGILVLPEYWVLEHGNNVYEVLSDEQFKSEYQKCEFVSADTHDYMTGPIEHNSEDPKHEKAKMSSDEGMQKASQYVCPTCNNVVDPATPDWRFDDGKWQHYHGYRTGWIEAVLRL